MREENKKKAGAVPCSASSFFFPLRGRRAPFFDLDPRPASSPLFPLTHLFFSSSFPPLHNNNQKTNPVAPPSSRSSSSRASSRQSSFARPGARSSSPFSPPRPPLRQAASRSASGTRASGTAGGATSPSGRPCPRSHPWTRAGGTSWCRRRTASSQWGEERSDFEGFLSSGT